MKYSHHSIKALFWSVFILLNSTVQAQYIQSASDTAFFKKQVQFPEVSMDMFITFKSSTFAINTPYEEEEIVSFEDLQKRLEEDPEDAEAHYKIMFYLREEMNTDAKVIYHLETALKLCLAQHESAPDYENTLLLSQILTTTGHQEQAAQVWYEYTQYEPDDARGWADLALIELQMLQVKEAGTHLLTAYEHNPNLEQVYVLAIMHQVYIFLLENSTLEEPMLYWDFDDSFFLKAMEENPSAELPRLAWNAGRLLVVFMETALQNRDKIVAEKPTKLKINSTNKKVIKELKIYLNGLAQKELKNPFFIHKCLMLIHVLEGNMDDAQTALNQALEVIPNHKDLYKFIAFGFLPQQEYTSALQFMQKYIAAAPDAPPITDLLLLARLHYEAGQYIEALHILENESYMLQAYQQRNVDWMMALTDIYFHLDYWSEACEVATIFRSPDSNQTDEWYATLCALTSNDEDTPQLFEKIIADKDHYYYDNAKQLYKKLIK